MLDSGSTFYSVASQREHIIYGLLIESTKDMAPTLVEVPDGSKRSHNRDQDFSDIDDFLQMLIDENHKQGNQGVFEPPLPIIKTEGEPSSPPPYNQCIQEERLHLMDQLSPYSHGGIASPASAPSPTLIHSPYSYPSPDGSGCGGAMSAPDSPFNDMSMDGQVAPAITVTPPPPSTSSSAESINKMNLDTFYKYDPRPLGRKRSRKLVPEEKKTREYWERRRRNNEAARRSREERRMKELQTFENMKHLYRENVSLKQTISILLKERQDMEGQMAMMRQLLDQPYKGPI